jgi:hypothetical protein
VPLVDVIDEVPSLEWEFWEIFYIGLFKSWGFNLTNNTIGGNGTGSGECNPNYGKKLTKDHKMKCSLKLRGDKNPFYGKKHSEDAIKKFSKPILQYSIDGKFIKEWNSIRSAERELKISSISTCCHKKLLSSGGFIWRFKTESKIPRNIIVDKTYRRPVFQYTKDNTLIKKWDSIRHVERELGVYHISQACSNKPHYKSIGGFIWKYN